MSESTVVGCCLFQTELSGIHLKQIEEKSMMDLSKKDTIISDFQHVRIPA